MFTEPPVDRLVVQLPLWLKLFPPQFVAPLSARTRAGGKTTAAANVIAIRKIIIPTKVSRGPMV